MSQVEELLTSLVQHIHPVSDTDEYFVIDPTTRNIERSTRYSNVLMQYDHNSERYTFKLPRYIDGHDMSKCTSVVVNFDNIEAETGKINSGPHDMDDLRINPDDTETVISSWLISRDSTQLAGILSFSIEYKCVDDEGNAVYEWGTNIYDEVEVKPRKKNSEAVISEHVDILEQWRTKIFGAGDSVIADIAAEGEAQVAAVKTESETQQEAVELKGAQTLDSIPEDYTEVDAMADEAVRSKADAITCEAAGESIVLKDSSNDHIRGLKLFGKSTQRTTTGKNLLAFSYKDLSKTENGVTLTVNGDGSISFSGTATGYAGIPLYEGYASVFPSVITIFALGVFSNAVLHIVLVDKNGSTILETNLTRAAPYRTIDFSQYIDVERITINAKRYDTGAVLGTIYPMIVSGETNSATYEPYTGGKPAPNPEYPQDVASVVNPVINIHGKNLAKTSLNIQQVNGYTLTPNNDGSVTVTGSAAAAVDTVFDLALVPATGAEYERVFLPANTTFSLSSLKNGEPTNVPAIRQVMSDGSVKWGWSATEQEDRYITKIYRQFVPEVGDTSMCGTYTVQIELGSVVTDYEPYVEPRIVSMQHTLPGIPVTSDGNYIDSDGQQWICDEVDLERGVYVQRIREITYNGTDESWFRSVDADSYMHHTKVEDHLAIGQGICYCDKLLYKKTSDIQAAGKTEELLGISPSPKYNVVYINLGYYLSENTPEALAAYLSENPITLHYVLKTPIEKPLTAEEITAFKALRTNYPNTTILNDAGAWMSVKYNADTKTYIENPKILKLTDSSTGVVYELKIIDGNLTVTPV